MNNNPVLTIVVVVLVIWLVLTILGRAGPIYFPGGLLGILLVVLLVLLLTGWRP